MQRAELGEKRFVAGGQRRFECFDRQAAPAGLGLPRDEHVGEEAELLEPFGVERRVLCLKLCQRAGEKWAAPRKAPAP